MSVVNANMTIFDYLYPRYKITKPIRLIELFRGYGSQALALRYLGAPFESWKICEWNYKSCEAYCLLHCDDKTDYSKDKNKKEIVEYLLKKGVSSDWNKPMTEKQVNNLSEEKLKQIYNNIKQSNNMVNIMQVRGEDLETEDRNYAYIMTYSFPCQDLSQAGNRKGMADTNTRSGMLWEVERILNEVKHKPDVLVMENVPQIHDDKNYEHFVKWQTELEKMGYQNYWKDMSADQYGMPQMRDRTFMVSILGDYVYQFPGKEKLKIKLRDLLEKEVEEKYWLPDKYLKNIKVFEPSKNQVRDLNYSKQEASNRVWNINNVAPTLCASFRDNDYLQNVKVLINNKVRVLTPREAFRLMGVKDEDFEKIKGLNNNTLYHLAGDSIVTNVLMAIFRELI